MKFLLMMALLGTGTAFAQLSSYKFNDELKVKFNVRLASINTYGLGEDSVKDVAAILIRALEFDRINYGAGEYQGSNRWAFLPESLIHAFVDAVNGGDFEWGQKITSTNIGDFILGWHNHAWSFLYTDKFSLSGGVHWGDYFYGFEPYDRSSRNYGKAMEPAGWYGALGPALMFDIAVTRSVVLHGEGSYAFTTKFMDFPEMISDKGYPDPRFVNFTLQARTNSILHGGIEYIRSLNHGDNPFNASRTDFFIGIWL